MLAHEALNSSECWISLHGATLLAANNYANSLFTLERFEEGKSLLKRMISVARRVLGEGNQLTLQMSSNYTLALYNDNNATLDDLREAVTTLEDIEPIARRVLGGAHPITSSIELSLREARPALRARETPGSA